jgi:hypothetical protein
VLLDVLEALGPQRGAIIVVGAQAVYMRTGDGDIAVAPFTSDADLALTPDDLADHPLLERLMRDAYFSLDVRHPGSWYKRVNVGHQSVDISVDIMVPDGFAPAGGRRSVRMGPHDRMAARRAVGLEGAAIDYDRMDVNALDSADARMFTVRVAGPAALVVAKLHKINDRLKAGKPDRIAEKDAADVYRIMQAIPVDAFLVRLRSLLEDRRSAGPSSVAVGSLGVLFGAPRAQAVRMAVESLRVAVPAERVEAVCVAFASQVRRELAR